MKVTQRCDKPPPQISTLCISWLLCPGLRYQQKRIPVAQQSTVESLVPFDLGCLLADIQLPNQISNARTEWSFIGVFQAGSNCWGRGKIPIPMSSVLLIFVYLIFLILIVLYYFLLSCKPPRVAVTLRRVAYKFSK